MIPIPLLVAGMELLNTSLSGDKKQDEQVVNEVLGKVKKAVAEKPFYQSKRAIGTSITIVLLMFNKKLGLDLDLATVTAITTLVSAYVASKSYEQK